MQPTLPSFYEGSMGSRIFAEILENPEKGCKYYPELLITFDQDIGTWKATQSWDRIIEKERMNKIIYRKFRNGVYTEEEYKKRVDTSFDDAFDLYSASAEIVVAMGENCGINNRKCYACKNDILGMSVIEGQTCYCNDDINPFNNDIVEKKSDVEFDAPLEVSDRFYNKFPLRKKDVAIVNYMLRGIQDTTFEDISKAEIVSEELSEETSLYEELRRSARKNF